jgi:hypothetical protein
VDNFLKVVIDKMKSIEEGGCISGFFSQADIE